MSKLLPLLFTLLFIACNDQSGIPNLTEKVKAQAVEKIKADLKNPMSYSPVEWSEVDTLYSSFNDDPEYARFSAVIDSLDSIQNEIQNKILKGGDPESGLSNIDKLDSIMKQGEEFRRRQWELIKHIKRENVGWWANHKFKIMGELGTPEFITYRAYFDKQMNVTKVEDVTAIVR